MTQMYAANYLPNVVKCAVSGAQGELDANARRSDDGRTLVLIIVNPGAQPARTQIKLAGFAPTRPSAIVTELSGPLEAVNSAENPRACVPKRSEWKHETKEGRTSCTVAPHSITVLRFE
jgi:alpha-L-arabinofuranosidase